MPTLPAHILACPGSLDLILRALRGDLPQGNYYDAWDGLADPGAYRPSEEVRIWLHPNWGAIMPAQQTRQGQTIDSTELSHP